MKTFRIFVLILAICAAAFILGGVAHEADIRRQCIQTGHAGQAGWLGDFECHIPVTQGKH